MSTTELEVKLELGKETVRRLPKKSALQHMTLGKPAQKKLQSTYYDTAAHRLRDEAASLRIRWDGKNWIQTLKYGNRIEHGVSNPVEIERILDEPKLELDRIDDPKIKPWLSGILAEGPLEPVFETDIDRNIHLLRCDDIGTVELAIDKGAVKNPSDSATINEVELELKSGLPFALLTVSELLFEGERITASTASKSERGYALSQPPCEKAAGGVHAHRPKLEADWPAVRAFKAIGRSAASQVLDNWIRLSQSDESEVPHQLRIGLRRMRVCLKVFQSHLTSDNLKRLSHEARDMGRLVGELRNADVLLEDIAQPAIDALGSNKNHRATIKHLEKGRQDWRRRVREALDSERWTHFKLNCMLFEQAVDRAFLGAAAPPPDESVKATAARELERTWHRVLKKGRNFSRHSNEQRHELRKTLKSMRYTSEHFLQLHSGDDPDLFFSKLRQLQNVFGYLNDVAMAEELEASIAAEMPDRKDLHRSMRAIVAWHRERSDKAMQKADRRWQKLMQAEIFWRPAR